MITQSELKEKLEYNPETGNFTWKSTSHKAKIGSISGTKTAAGYRTIGLKDKQ
jgi:hypothetical protein